MSTEPGLEINLDAVTEEVLSQTALTRFEKDQVPFLTLTASISQWEKVQSSLLILRASNISALLLIKRDIEIEDDELLPVFAWLRDLDQLLLHNFLELCSGWIPKDALPHLEMEAKIELKWFKEWLMAACDSRIHKYPGLPWRSFIRKINAENYAFGERFLELAFSPNSPENIQKMNEHLKAFLVAKKKVVCVFPKNWGKGH